MKTRVFKFKALLTDKQKQLFSETEKEQQLLKAKGVNKAVSKGKGMDLEM